ncbi:MULTISPECIES: iron-hydroxamate ABC transporter substrate-binding protein [Bacillus]|uniref:iron-hydroxamate ABC transporter substrate-binding protein n=1 Tax=Bacillus TaxID=1386 RepID=UPI000BA74C40|nr:iron-hydroxamate ABC transporter substrate-binding protein [Bacillus licheniformis]MEC2291755.1 iron-hydroxamate ABC transporter substrate-binding protein [Bacillus licheniformis]PAE41578.1 iron(3+)-hydroxamate-binding protein fhuD [Bacillus licheniformis]TWK70214.1 Iron(3+)-hydroxamate-binding protein FhuD [Bacillus licheniformis]TWL72743.1 Iron(3+)-hydroxamate-binding protein FhuD [Bacillus licheniformis]
MNIKGKTIAAACFVLLLIAALTACGNQIESKDSSSKSKSEETITYKAENGTVKVPKHPKRVVVMADDYFGYFKTLGLNVVGAPDRVFKNPYFKGKTDGVTNIGEGNSAEKVIQLKPDLIVVWTTQGADIEKLEKIAPTVALKYDSLNSTERLKDFAKMTGTEDQAEKWLAEWDKKVAAAKSKVQKAVGNKTVSIMQTNGKEIFVFGDQFGRGGSIVYQDLGLKATKLTKEKAIDEGPGYTSISLEKLPDFAGDYIFIGPWESSGDDSAVLNTSIWKNLGAVKNQHVYKIDPVGFYFSDPISLEGQLEFITENLTK